MKYKAFTGLGAVLLISAFYVVFFANTAPLYGNECKYTEKIAECSIANQGGDPLSIDDFLCPQSGDEELQAYQIALDVEFNLLDDQLELYLDGLQTNKSQYYGGAESYLDGYDDITKKLGAKGEYYKKYKYLCDASNPDGIVQQGLVCLKGSATASESSNFFTGENCTILIGLKLSAYRSVAENILYLNKAQVLTDRQKGYTGEEKKTYSALLDKFMYNIGLIQKISNKWVTKTERDGSNG